MASKALTTLCLVIIVLATLQVSRAAQCTIETGKFYQFYSSLGAVPTSSAQNCCDLCAATTGCTMWTYSLGSCNLGNQIMSEGAWSSATRGTLSSNPGVGSDPIITGFNGVKFHFDETGDFELLASEGIQVHVTFAGATAADASTQVMEKSWTSSVRVNTPNGDMVACALPSILSNTSKVEMTAAAADAGQDVLLSPSKPDVAFAHMSASVVLSEGASPHSVKGCRIVTPKFIVMVHQISGWEQATLHPDTEAWAAPFTWLDTSIVLTKPLAIPVTGILGSTYPVDKEAEQAFLRAAKDDDQIHANIDGEDGSARALAGVEAPVFLSAGITCLVDN